MMPHTPLETARQSLGITVLELWFTYFALGGTEDADALAAYLDGQATATTATHNTIATPSTKRSANAVRTRPCNTTMSSRPHR
jgi:hypothetical protein